MATEQENNNNTKETESYITTLDNPFNPQTQYDEWYEYDLMLGYNTTQRLARMIDYLVKTLKIDDPDLVTDMAMLEIIRLDPLKQYTILHLDKKDYGTVKLTDEQKAQLELAKNLK